MLPEGAVEPVADVVAEGDRHRASEGVGVGVGEEALQCRQGEFLVVI